MGISERFDIYELILIIDTNIGFEKIIIDTSKCTNYFVKDKKINPYFIKNMNDEISKFNIDISKISVIKGVNFVIGKSGSLLATNYLPFTFLKKYII